MNIVIFNYLISLILIITKKIVEVCTNKYNYEIKYSLDCVTNGFFFKYCFHKRRWLQQTGLQNAMAAHTGILFMQNII